MKKTLCIVLSVLLLILPCAGAAFAADAPVFAAGTVEAHAGGTVDVPITLAGNTGLAGCILLVSYDADVLTLTGCDETGTAITGGDFVFDNTLTDNPFRILWMDALGTSAHTENGLFATLHFAVSETAAAGSTTAITLLYDPGSTFDMSLTNIACTMQNGSVTILGEPTLSVGTLPAKTEYTIGETLDTTGLTLTYTDQYGAASTISEGFTCLPTTFGAVGTQTISVLYNGLTATFDVTVSDVQGGWNFAEGSGLCLLSGNGKTYLTGLDADYPIVTGNVETTGGWSYTVIPNGTGNESTGAVLEICDANGILAERYEVVVYGDIDGNGETRLADVAETISGYAGVGNTEWEEYDSTFDFALSLAADVDHNGEVSLADAAEIMAAANLVEYFNQSWQQDGDATILYYDD